MIITGPDALGFLEEEALVAETAKEMRSVCTATFHKDPGPNFSIYCCVEIQSHACLGMHDLHTFGVARNVGKPILADFSLQSCLLQHNISRIAFAGLPVWAFPML